MSKKTLSLVIVDTDAHILSKAAVDISLSRHNFDDVLIFSDTKEIWGEHEVIIIPKLSSMRDYNNTLFRVVPQYLKTDFFLVIQYDGFILNPDEFSNYFYHYDYIGAPWDCFKVFNVGNGGFSWRSRKLADAVQNISQGSDLSFQEDVYICRENHLLLEEKFGCNFSDNEIAEHFSIETGARRFPTFGFHGLWHLPDLYRNHLDWFVHNLTPNILRKKYEFNLLEKTIKNISEEHHQILVNKRARILDIK